VNYPESLILRLTYDSIRRPDVILQIFIIEKTKEKGRAVPGPAFPRCVSAASVKFSVSSII
jgi:hypothetical protein